MTWALILNSPAQSENSFMCLALAKQLEKQKISYKLILLDQAVFLSSFSQLPIKLQQKIIVCSRSCERFNLNINNEIAEIGSLTQFMEQQTSHWFQF